MSKYFLRVLALGIVFAGGVFGQQGGTFAHIAYGGPWQTTFTLLNLSTTEFASVTLSFFGDNGAPLNAPVQGFGNTSAHTFTIPVGGSQNVVLSSSDPVTTGWANMTVATGIVRGQGSFRSSLPSGAIFEAVVPLSTSGSTACIVPFPTVPGAPPLILIPFDNTAGNVTSLAFASTATGSLNVSVDFVDQAGALLVTDTVSLDPNHHTAFVTRDRDNQTAGKKGVIRIHQLAQNLSVLGLQSNPTNAITTIIPIIQ